MARVNGPSRKELDARGNELAARVRRAIDSTLRALPRDADVEELNRIRTAWRDVALRSLVPRLYIAWDTAVAGVRTQLEHFAGPERVTVAATIFEIPKVSNALAELFLADATNRLVGIGDHVWEVARAELLEGMQLGEGAAELRERVMASADVSARRAEVIARTEVNSAMNNGAYQQMKSLDMPTIKEWIATSDSRTRESHEEVDGEEIAGDAKFTVGGFPMDHPHDLDAPPGETINCRCTIAWEVDFDALDDEEESEENEESEEEDTEDDLLDNLLSAGDFDEAEHPRDGKGRFAKKPGSGFKVGKKLKITHGFIHKNRPVGTTVAVSSDGRSKVVFTGGTGILNGVTMGPYTHYYRKSVDDEEWKKGQTFSKAKAYQWFKDESDLGTEWHEPASEDDSDEQVDTPETAQPKGPTKKKTTASTGGAPLKITHGLVHKKHEPGEVITENGAGDKRVVWDGDKYRLQSKVAEGNWTTEKTAIKSKAYVEINAYDSDWRAPKTTKSSDNATVQPSTSTPASLEITPALFSGDHEIGAIITQNGTGSKRVIWDGDYYRLQNKTENGWKTQQTVEPKSAAEEVNDFDSDWRVPMYATITDVPKSTPVATSTPAAPVSVVDSGTKTFTALQKAKVQGIFAKHNLKWHNKTNEIYDAAHEVSTTHSDLTMADALDIMDQSLQKKTGNPFRTKVEKWLKTSAGKQHVLAKGGSASLGGTSPKTQPVAPPVSTPKPAAKIPSGSTVPLNENAPGVTYVNNSPFIKPGTTVPPGTPLSKAQIMVSPTGGNYKPVDDPGGALPRDLSRNNARILQQRMSLATPPPWTQAEQASLNNYTGGAYRAINSCARGIASCDSASLSDLANIKSAMKPSTDTIILHRMTEPSAFGLPAADKMKDFIGKTIKDDGVISTSTEPDTWSGVLSLEIEAPKGSMMAYVQPLSKHPAEEEMIVAPGTHYEVVAVTPISGAYGGYKVKLRIIPGSDTRSREDREKLALQQQIENLQKAKVNA